MYSLTHISNIIEHNIVWLQKVKYSPVQKGFIPPASIQKLLALHFLCVYQENEQKWMLPPFCEL